MATGVGAERQGQFVSCLPPRHGHPPHGPAT
jgi:hypothetical protein